MKFVIILFQLFLIYVKCRVNNNMLVKDKVKEITNNKLDEKVLEMFKSFSEIQLYIELLINQIKSVDLIEKSKIT
jgi:hypothetical protein